MASTTDLTANAEPAPLHKHPYHLVDPSPWPLVGAFAGAALLLGIILYAHYNIHWMLGLGFVATLATMFFWWRDVLRESRTPGLHTPVVRIGLRYGMTLFIASEVMFFVAFFWAYFHFALYPGHVSGAEVAVWPPQGTLTFDPFGLPFLNTMILLLSGCTVTWAHHGLLHGDRKALVQGLALTVLLGVTFTFFQVVEYAEAPFAFTGGVYPSVFFLATGFHGFHVMVGTLFLLVCLIRSMRGDFTPQRHFGFEAAAWYWHFVDVVWLFLFICIYWWGAGEIMEH
ncbi:cytochrome c oxidase subunit III [Siccirubricoccus deserti]|uniref:Cytochrome c oxidase subunit 3 n=1 Tax=Siccirubricoccus deserti TaxID=2013562 RepID=A0A9X0QVB9_9PROT|nr:cytochrome c oxidase subunit 3 [Siccirubricoccus deserti]MBC4014494.1 cytochrome c oxidase subunit 3 [Siccirubricoccus deserti]GGC32467.1 cytochrome c oxidase subunit III [Siccirubricoccus deserti]